MNQDSRDRDNLEEDHRLLRLWKETAPPEPSDQAWREVLAGLVMRLSQQPKIESGKSHWIRAGFLGAAAAAIIILAVVLPRRETTRPVPSPGPVDGMAQIGELPIVADDDVDLFSIHGKDADLLVVGKLPVQSPLVLMAKGDVTLESLGPDLEGVEPQKLDASDSPMIVAPLPSSTPKDSGTK